MTAREYARRFEFLIEPAKKVTEAYERGTRYFDQLKEIVLIEFALVHTSEFIHNTAHWFPTQFDLLGDILHQCHIMQVYGETGAFNRDIRDMNDVFTLCLEQLDEIENALQEFVEICELHNAWALARQTETLQINNRAVCDKYLKAWAMYEEATSATSYDNWIARLSEISEKVQDDD